MTKKRWSIMRGLEWLGATTEAILGSTLAVALILVIIALLVVTLVISSLHAISVITNR
jgi:hypothetical protein